MAISLNDFFKKKRFFLGNRYPVRIVYGIKNAYAIITSTTKARILVFNDRLMALLSCNDSSMTLSCISDAPL